MITPSKKQAVWMFSAALCGVAVAVSFACVDDKVMWLFARNNGKHNAVGAGLATSICLYSEAATVLALIIARLVLGRGKLPFLSKALALACLTSLCVFAVNDGVLKFFFGVPNPEIVMTQRLHHGFNFFRGAHDSSFPSGHMMLVSSFAGVFMRLYSPSIAPFAVLLTIVAVALIVGDWHFVSDIIAGTFLGLAFGYLAANLWLDRTK